MPPRNERVVAMVRAELKKDPRVTNDDLLKKARALDGGLRRMSPRQFHGTYRLPAARAAKLAQGRAAGPASETPASEPRRRTTRASAPAPSRADVTDQPPGVSARDGATAAPAAAPSSTSQRSSSTALSRPHAAEREMVRQILQTVAREALVTEDRASFVRLLDSLDDRAAVVLGVFGRT